MYEKLNLPDFPKVIRHLTDLREALGVIALHTGDDEQRYDKISKPYREALSLCSEMEVVATEKRMTEVLNKAKQTLALFPALFEALRARADSYFVLEDYRNALTAYGELLREHPNASDIHYQMGRCHFELQDIDSSTREFELEMQISGEAPDIYLQLGGLLMSRGKSTFLELFQNRGITDRIKLYQACGKDYEKAVQYFKRGLQIDPQNVELQQLLQDANSILSKLK